MFSWYLLAVSALQELLSYIYKKTLFFLSPPLCLLQYLFVSGLQRISSKTNGGAPQASLLSVTQKVLLAECRGREQRGEILTCSVKDVVLSMFA